jgi:hypothetical protein
MNSQSTEILAHLRAGLSITPLDAFKRFNCLRLGARIYELKARGHDIYSVYERSGEKRYCRYFLRKGKPSACDSVGAGQCLPRVPTRG